MGKGFLISLRHEHMSRFFFVGRGFAMMADPLSKDVSDIHRQDLEIQKIRGLELNQLIVP